MNEAELSLPLLRWSVCLCIWSLKELRIHFVSYSLSPSYLSLSSLSHLSLFPVEHSGRNQSRELFCIMSNCTFTSNLGHNILSKWMFFFFFFKKVDVMIVRVFLCEFVIHSTCVCGWFLMFLPWCVYNNGCNAHFVCHWRVLGYLRAVGSYHMSFSWWATLLLTACNDLYSSFLCLSSFCFVTVSVGLQRISG